MYEQLKSNQLSTANRKLMDERLKHKLEKSYTTTMTFA